MRYLDAPSGLNKMPFTFRISAFRNFACHEFLLRGISTLQVAISKTPCRNFAFRHFAISTILVMRYLDAPCRDPETSKLHVAIPKTPCHDPRNSMSQFRILAFRDFAYREFERLGNPVPLTFQSAK
jgi:hypothetical protein